MRALGLTLFAAAALIAGDSKDQLSQAQIDEIIQKFAAKEAEFARARENYTYRQSAKIQEMSESGAPGGKWEEVSDIIFTSDGKRTEHVVRAPVTTLQQIQMDPGDLEDIRHTQPFVLTTQELP